MHKVDFLVIQDFREYLLHIKIGIIVNGTEL